jgi:hypothetical protein
VIEVLSRVVAAPPGKPVRAGAGQGQQRARRLALQPQTWDREETVIAVDLSHGMLALSAAGHRLQADAARLPLASRSADAVIIGDGPLFAAEVARVMTGQAVLVWSNALGTGAPFYLPAATVTEAMTWATGRDWDATESQAHWGTWAVLRPARSPHPCGR